MGLLYFISTVYRLPVRSDDTSDLWTAKFGKCLVRLPLVSNKGHIQTIRTGWTVLTFNIIQKEGNKIISKYALKIPKSIGGILEE